MNFFRRSMEKTSGLQNFLYRTSINVWTLLISAVLALIIALFTVSYQPIKAAWANPADALRYQ